LTVICSVLICSRYGLVSQDCVNYVKSGGTFTHCKRGLSLGPPISIVEHKVVDLRRFSAQTPKSALIQTMVHLRSNTKACESSFKRNISSEMTHLGLVLQLFFIIPLVLGEVNCRLHLNESFTNCLVLLGNFLQLFLGPRTAYTLAKSLGIVKKRVAQRACVDRLVLLSHSLFALTKFVMLILKWVTDSSLSILF
jgi:hypothetical protein